LRKKAGSCGAARRGSAWTRAGISSVNWTPHAAVATHAVIHDDAPGQPLSIRRSTPTKPICLCAILDPKKKPQHIVHRANRHRFTEEMHVFSAPSVLRSP